MIFQFQRYNNFECDEKSSKMVCTDEMSLLYSPNVCKKVGFYDVEVLVSGKSDIFYSKRCYNCVARCNINVISSKIDLSIVL